MRTIDGVSKMKNGTWQYRFEGSPINGRRLQIAKCGFATHDEALAAKLMAMNEYKKVNPNFTGDGWLMRKEIGVNQMKNGKWQYRFEGSKVNGKRKQISKSGFATYEEALAAKLMAMAEYKKNNTNVEGGNCR